MTPTELKHFRSWLVLKNQYCQICGSGDIDVPHHVGIGAKRDDYEQIVLCCGCHRKVHNVLFTWHITPDTEEMEFIAKENRRAYESRSTH